MATSSSSFSSSSKYDVFLSFREEDTRENFTSHLFVTLCRKKIKTFIDEDVNKEDEIPSALVDAIEESKISIIIFSKDYAFSTWCLDEVVKIHECEKLNGQIVIPNFYHVHPFDVWKQAESFGKASTEHEKHFKKIPEKVKKWRDALIEVSYLVGHESINIRLEAELVDVIVKDVLKKLEDIIVSTDLDGLVGINSQIEQVKSLLCFRLQDFRFVGIWGMSGIGKITLAKAIFKQYLSDFEGKCFMTNVRQKTQQEGGLEYIQKQVFSYLLDENLEKGPNIPYYTKKRLQCLKICIVLDDVDKLEQLEALAKRLKGLGLGSRIIITTRDTSVWRGVYI
ncbi:Disease resistance protein (TIR-NBS-LRR class) [Melia azedarach]|uniref:Disease resistance protein (TIR-NBS-LRR class) n=1 Tax=Melia azedarach TaxID=155640 RepID=A0ACC1YHQ0_MELAZ|nr:Disease resistance protein (TIR-NBS-LRR class) [Melia azedarach]